MADEVWEDYQPSSGGEVWQDYSPPQPDFRQQVEEQAPWYTKAASGAASGLAGLLDLGQTVASYMPGMSGLRESAQMGNPSAGDMLRGGLDLASGVQDSTKVGEGGYAHKLGEYLPAVALGGGDLIKEGATDSALSIAKLLGLDTYFGTAGYAGHEIGGAPGEIAANLLAGGAPLLASKGYNALADIPTEEQALLKAFRVPESKVEDISPALNSLKNEQGIISKWDLNSETPFQDINRNLKEAIPQTSQDIAETLKGSSTTVSDIWPESSLFEGKLKSGDDTNAAIKALKTEQDNLTKFALSKEFPAPEGKDPLVHADDLLNQYKGFEKAAKAGDKDAKAAISILDEKIDSASISGQELWDLRQSYDKAAKWNINEPAGKADAYRAMRDAAQKKVLELGGEPAAPLFNDLRAQLQGEGVIEKLAGAERLGKTQPPGLVQEFLGNPLKKYIWSKVGIGHVPAVKSETSLNQVFGNSSGQQIASFLSGTSSSLAQKSLAPVLKNSISASQGSKSESPIVQPQYNSQERLQEKSILPSLNSTKNYIDNKVSKAEASMNVKVPEKLVKAVITQESAGKVDAVSSKGARGLMQIMPETAKEIAKEMGLEDYDLNDPETNKKMGEYYLGKMLKAFDGDVHLALAAYNWGIGSVKKATAKYGDSWEAIKAHAPDETKTYVKNISKSYFA